MAGLGLARLADRTEDVRKEILNWRRYNRKVEVGPEDARGCKRVVVEWDEDYEFRVVVCVKRKRRWDLRLEIPFSRYVESPWFEVKKEHHREAGIEYPDTQMYASLPPRPTEVCVNEDILWEGDHHPAVSVISGGEAAPIFAARDLSNDFFSPETFYAHIKTIAAVKES